MIHKSADELAKLLPELNLKKLITVPTHADGKYDMSIGSFLMSVACTYGKLD